jgi:hypothetical protein
MCADLHIGGTTGLMPPRFITFEGNEVRPNAYQKWTWKAWIDCWKWARQVFGKDEWAAAIVGDAIDGVHHTDNGNRELWSITSDDHASSAVGVLKDVLMDASQVFVLEGTHCHTTYSEHGIATALEHEGVKIHRPSKQQGAWPELDLRLHGSLSCIDHHISATSRSQSESSAYSATLADVRNRRSRAGLDVPKLVVRAHRHQFGCWDDGYAVTVVLPPWQGNTRYTHRVVPRAVPQCGLVIADWRNVPYGERPVIHSRIHTLA